MTTFTAYEQTNDGVTSTKTRKTMDELERSYLFVDGDHGCALLGDNIQDGECEFVKIIKSPKVLEEYAMDAACKIAYRKLHERLPDRKFSYVMQTPHGTHWTGP